MASGSSSKAPPWGHDVPRIRLTVLVGLLLCVSLGLERNPPTLAASSEAIVSAPSDPVIRFTKTVIDTEFRSEGVAVGDVNRDGRRDILAGNLWYEAPASTPDAKSGRTAPSWRPHEIAPVEKFDAAAGYSDSFLNFARDVNGDGWVDQIVLGFPGKETVWRENPQGSDGPWRKHLISATNGNESPAMAPLLPKGPPVLVYGVQDSLMAWFEPASPVTKPFLQHVISKPGAPGTHHFAHGLGVGDLTGDGRSEIIVTKGYWVAPADPREGPWPFASADLGPDCAQMAVYDVNGDGMNDVVSSSAHATGVWWFQQQRAGDRRSFVRHTIDESFSQSHSLAASDINGDGLLDIVTGKRFWAHGPKGDVAPNAPAVLHWFELQRDDGRVTWSRHQIDDDSGVGTQVVAEDVDDDELIDVVVANKKGVFVFHQRRSQGSGGRDQQAPGDRR